VTTLPGQNWIDDYDQHRPRRLIGPGEPYEMA
jgi:hypothetical protein